MSDKSPSMVQTLMSLKEKFDKIVGHISDFSFVADTVKRQEHFKLYTQKVFLLALTLREAGEYQRKLHQEDAAVAKFKSSAAIIDELFYELSLAKMVKSGGEIQRNSSKVAVGKSGHDEEAKDLTQSACQCRSRIKAFTFTNFLELNQSEPPQSFESTRFFAFEEDGEISEELLANLRDNLKYLLSAQQS